MKPDSIIFFPNGQAAVCGNGQQLPKYQGTHEEAIKALTADGIDWRTIPEILGAPNRPWRDIEIPC